MTGHGDARGGEPPAVPPVRARCVYDECGRWFRYDPQSLSGSSFPFCSPRCKGADLGRWVDEDYRVPSLPDLRGLDDEEDEPGPPPADAGRSLPLG